jgi:eukaryotic-like serine/threonine-protein kinase
MRASAHYVPFPAGTQLGPYELLSLLGSGGSGEVYRARDSTLDRFVAIKTLRAEVAADLEHVRRFEREARAASALNHPNILTIYGVGREGSTAYIAMEWVDGTNLRDVMAASRLPMRQLMKIAEQIAAGLVKAHAAGIIHRDLKPANVMIKGDGVAKIVDFGLAKLMARPHVSTLPGMLMGTLGYLSPEQANAAPADHRSDQFAFGVIVYEMATGHRPFHRETATQTLAATIDEDPTPIRELNTAVPEHLAAVVDRCLAKDPRDRYESTGDLARDMEQISEGASSRVATVSVSTRRLRRWMAIVAVIAAIITIAVVARMWFHTQ